MAAGSEGKIADGFSLYAEPVLTVEEVVVGVVLGNLGSMAGRLLIGGALSDEPNHVFAAPFQLDEFVGQPVEQGRVGRSITACAKIIHGTHESFPKELAPDVVGGNTWHDGVLAINQPTGKIKPVALGTVFDNGQGCEDAGGYLLAGLLEFAAMEDVRGARVTGALGNNAHTHHGRFGGAIGEFF